MYKALDDVDAVIVLCIFEVDMYYYHILIPVLGSAWIMEKDHIQFDSVLSKSMKFY